jgi:uncharacterized repeat protein (TIGR03803 family)
MKTFSVPGRKPVLPLLRQLVWAAVLLLPAFDALAGVIFTSFYSFGVSTNGAFPSAGLVQGSDGSFYGTTYWGGTNGGNGTVFKISTNGTFISLHSFTFDDGAYPYAGLVQGSDGYLYGTTSSGGSYSNQYGGTGFGTVFKISTNGAFTSLYSFTGGDYGGGPYDGLVQGSDGNFYGTTTGFKGGGYGTVFKISTNGLLDILYSFTNGVDGAIPLAGLVQGTDGNLYGTTEIGGANGDGVVFQISTNGVLTTLYSFTNGVDGVGPCGGLVQGSDGSFYGATSGAYTGEGGSINRNPGDSYGTVFRISTNGALTTLYAFTNGVDGANPEAGLAQGSDGYFYGTTYYGGYLTAPGFAGFGTVFKISTNGGLTTLQSFGSFLETVDSGISLDGANSTARLVQGSDGNLYGTTSSGAPTDMGTVFKISTNGVLTSLYLFPDGNDNGLGPGAPSQGLVQGSDGYLYGTSESGGTNGDFREGFGTVFKISTNGVLTSFYSFTAGNDGYAPLARLMQGSDGYLYGTTYYGGTNGLGTVFKISTNGALTTLYDFGTVTDSFGRPLDGADPTAELVQGSDGYLYGTTDSGGKYVNFGYGTVFKISTNGTFTSLYSFTGAHDGANPYAGLVQGSDGSFYGTTYVGGTNGYGTVFKISTNGVLTSLYSFIGGSFVGGFDGANPNTVLVPGSDGYFYGTTFHGGDSPPGFLADGTVFKISTNGALTTLYAFTGGSDGANPNTELVPGSDGYFYGTTLLGGNTSLNDGTGDGTVFKISTNGVLTSLHSFAGGNDGARPNGLAQGSDGSFYGAATGGQGGEGILFRLTIGPDTLQISPAQGFASTGPFGGPFSVANLTYTLTNINAAALNWSLVNNSSWLDASSSGGTLGPGAAIGVTFSLNAAAYILAPGSYAATVVFSDLQDGSRQSRQFTLQTTDALQLTGFNNPMGAQLQVAGRYGQTFSIQTCTNLLPPIDWVTLTTLTMTTNFQPFLDTTAGNDKERFYRALLAVNTNCLPPPAGLVSWWQGEGNALDIVGGNNGTLEGEVSYTDGEVGQAFNFDGVSGFISTSLLVTNPQTFSLSLWLRTDTTNGGVLISFDSSQTGPGGNSYDRNIYMDDTGALHFGVWTGNPAPQQINSAAGYNDNNWHYAVGSLSPSTGLSLYVDGVLAGNNPAATSAASYDGYWRIGEDNLVNWPFQPSSYYFQGQIDEVAIFDRPLSPGEVYAIGAAGSAGMCRSP